MLLNRFGEKRLTNWFASSRRKPLVLRGARQVGKSTLVESFSNGAGLRLVAVNCEKNRRLDRVFESLDLARILPGCRPGQPPLWRRLAPYLGCRRYTPGQ